MTYDIYFGQRLKRGGAVGRSSKQQAAENRDRVVEIASRLFQQRGLAGLGIADLMQEAGMTHGAFYRQFPSKDDVAGEACARSMQRAADRWRGIAAAAPADEAVGRIVEMYLSGDANRHACAMPTLANEVAREPEGSAVRAAFTQGVRDFADVLAETMMGDRNRALGMLAAMVGAVALARAMDDRDLAAAFIESAKALCEDIATPAEPAG